MKKTLRLFSGLLLVGIVSLVALGGTTFIGNLVNLGQFGGTNVTLGSKTSASSMPVVIASDQGAVPVSGLALGLLPGTSVYISGSMARNVPVQTAVGCTTSSGQLLAGNANRVGLECDSDCNNTDRTFINWGAIAASNSMKRIETCASWQPPMVSTVAIQCLSNSGTQNIRCTEFNSL